MLSLLVLTFGLGFAGVLFQGRSTDSRARATLITGKTYYISPSGSDTNPGTKESPLKTINKGIFLTLPGDTVRILPGTYKENITISGKKGTSAEPIRIIGDSDDRNSYPVIDGGDSSFGTTDRPAFRISNSSWLTFERLKVINSTDSSFDVDGSHYITLRRNIVDYHVYGAKLRNKSSHILVEYNEIYQSYPDTSTWTSLKGSKWEGGAVTSFGGAGMNIIRFNYFRHAFNAIYLGNDEGGRVGNYYDANVWIYRNRFEDIVDDPYEPETYAFNNHFFQNTLINTHRMVSFAPGGTMLGPVYVYSNMQLLTKDITKEAASGRIDSAFKVELPSKYFPQGVFLFNNSVDVSYTGINGYGIDFLSGTVYMLTHINNAYRSGKNTFSKSSLTLNGSVFNGDISNKPFGYTEPNGHPSLEPGFSAPSQEDFRLTEAAGSRGKSRVVENLQGFASGTIIPSGSDLGAFIYSENDFRQTPNPVYLVPPGGEDSTFPANESWPDDIYGGQNPPRGPSWSPNGVWTSQPPMETISIPQTPTPTVSTPGSTATPTPKPTVTNTPIVTSTPKPTSTPTPIPTPVSPTAPVFQTTSLPIVSKNTPYSATVTVTDSTPSDVLTLSVTGLPSGISLKTCTTSGSGFSGVTMTCTIQGQTGSRGAYNPMFTAIDASQNKVTRTYKLMIK